MFVRAHSCGFVMNATMGPFRVVALSAEEWGFLTPTIAKSAHSKRQTGMVVQKLSTWGALRQICFTNVKYMVSRKVDRIVPIFFLGCCRS
ncbi:hypothetical protein RHMOL_Rhmol13G0083400 [Rhododendron molle]|uniref:Uncharacterized protein n=1 Tax=Rhododendron molle TaxID=49168 RepID=A0ACC0L4B4_RHOML|nr:hypothetical protein RHMOL_Rhmol13G0083400 [Rhododendron molle]